MTIIYIYFFISFGYTVGLDFECKYNITIISHRWMDPNGLDGLDLSGWVDLNGLDLN